MLATARQLNTELCGLDETKWKIEEKIFELDKSVQALEDETREATEKFESKLLDNLKGRINDFTKMFIGKYRNAPEVCHSVREQCTALGLRCKKEAGSNGKRPDEGRRKLREDLLALEREIRALEQPLNFKTLLDDLSDRLKVLWHRGDRIKSEPFMRSLDVLGEEYEVHLKKYPDLLERISEENQRIRAKAKSGSKRLGLDDYREALSLMEDKQEKIKFIAEFDGVVTLGLLIRVLEEIKDQNDRMLEKLLLTEGRKILQGVPDFEKYVASKFEALTDEPKNVIHEARVQLEMTRWKDHFCRVNKINLPKESEFFSGLNNQIYLVCALAVYGFTDRLMNKENRAKISFLAKTTRAVENPYLMLPYLADQLSITPDTETLWQEVAVMISGLYARSEKQIPAFLKTGQGQLTSEAMRYIAGPDDVDLESWKPPLTRMVMSMPHGVHASHLFGRLQHDVVSLSQSAKMKLANAGADLSPLMGGVSHNSLSDKRVDTVEQEDGSTVLLVHVPQGRTDTISQMVEKARDLLGLESVDRMLAQDLKDYAGNDVQGRLTWFSKCLEKHELTPAQDAMLSFVSEETELYFNLYVKRIQSYVEKLLHGVFFVRSVDASAVIKTIKEEYSVKKQLECLFKVYYQKRSEEPDDEIVNQIEEILIGAIDFLMVLPKLVLQTPETVASLKQPLLKQESDSPVSSSIQMDNPLVGYTRLIITVAEKDKLQLMRLVSGINDIDNKESVNHALYKELMLFEGKTEPEKMRWFNYCVSRHAFTEKQVTVLNDFPRKLHAIYQAYLFATPNYRGGRYTLWRANNSVVSAALKLVDQIPLVKDRLAILFDLRVSLIENQSQSLLQPINELLIECYHLLLASSREVLRSGFKATVSTV